MTEPAKDEADLLCALVDAIWQYLAPETRWTVKPYVERDLAAAIRAAWEDFKDDEGPTLTLEEIANVE